MPDTRFSNLVVRPDDSLEDALALIEGNRHRSVVVVDGRGVVVGTLSDGDARKAILDRRLLSTQVQLLMNTNFIALQPDGVGEAEAIFGREHIFVIPVVGPKGELLDILQAYE